MRLVELWRSVVNAWARSPIRFRCRDVARFSVVLLLPLLVLGSSNVASAQQRWAWFGAISAINKWSISSGQGDVTISGSSFSARLYSENGTPAITLKGRIQQEQVEAVAERQSTDDEPRKLAGTYRRISWKDGGGRESILLVESGQPWGLTVGVTRELPRP